MLRKSRRTRRPAIDTAEGYEAAWTDAVYFQWGGKSLTRAEFHARAFDSEADLRRLYETCRADFAAMAAPGTRHALWWEFDSPAPRDADAPEWQQLEGLGLLAVVEVEALQAAAVADDERLHYVPWHHGLPFRRDAAWWRFVAPEPRNPAVLESSQLTAMGVLTILEKQFIQDPAKVLRGAAGPRTKFYYLDPQERELLGLADGHSLATEALLAEYD